MTFNSLAFLAFFPCFLVLFALTRGRARILVCLFGSYFFYAWWDWRFLGLIFASSAVDYRVGRALGQAEDPGARKLLLALSVGFNLAILGFFKYFHFFATSVRDAFALSGIELPAPALEVVLPVGISFYTFQTLSYTIDVYRRRTAPEWSFLRYATFVSFFPQLVAGPIVRSVKLLPQLRSERQFDETALLLGFETMLWGFILKVVIADSLALLVDPLFAHPHLYNGLALALGVLFYSFQIYCDFAGYSFIAIGAARTMGFDLGPNFDRPYFSGSFSEFWTRWHISLSLWFRDFLYIPMGGNRSGAARSLRNAMITMLLAGLWHGASWTFVIWGGLHGVYLVVENALARPAVFVSSTLHLPRSLTSGLRILLVFGLTSAAWVFFRAQTIDDAWLILGRIAGGGDFALSGVNDAMGSAKGLVLIGALWICELLTFRFRLVEQLRARPYLRIAVCAMGIWMIALLGTFEGNRFIYFQF